MGLAVLTGRASVGIAAPLVNVEVLLSGGLPRFSIVGLVEAAVRESKDRVRGAILNSGFDFPQRRITVNLAPADMPKAGGRFDLAIALGILAASGQVRDDRVQEYEFYGELSLGGDLRKVPGILPAALRAATAGRRLIVPHDNAEEAALGGAKVLEATSLLEVAAHLNGSAELPAGKAGLPGPSAGEGPDLADVRGQQQARRALEIAAAGGHNLLYCGPPGTGKTMLARRLPGILPPMTRAEALETAAVTSVLGLPFDAANWRRRPFRAPHHTSSAAALVGGGSQPRPGEISRAHNGVLFLDELAEWNRHVLETLREPMESGTITVSRAARQAEFPARFQLVAAMNPCPCGYLGDPGAACHCSRDRVTNYRARISAPFIDRIDLHVMVARPGDTSIRDPGPRGETSRCVARRVEDARARQTARSGCTNAQIADSKLDCAEPDAEGGELLDEAVRRFALSLRAQRRVLLLARTIADLAGRDRVSGAHVAEALSLRVLDRPVSAQLR